MVLVKLELRDKLKMGDTSKDSYECDRLRPGMRPGMRPEQREAINTHVVDMMELEPRTLITHLYDNGTINFEQKEEIFKTPGRQKRAKKLVELLLEGDVHTFAGFLHGLNKSSKNRLAAKLKTTAENIVHKSVDNFSSKSTTTVSMVVGHFDKNIAVAKHSSVVSPLKPLMPIKVPTPEVVTELETEESEPPVKEAKHVDDSFDIYETLKVANDQMKSQVDEFLPLVNTINQDGSEQIQTELVGHMKIVEDEKARLVKSSQKDKKTFNRDMILLVINMNNVLDFMKDALLNLKSTLKDNESEYKIKIKKMEAEITTLKSQLSEKEEELIELQRDHMVSRVCMENDVNKAVQALNLAVEQQRKYFVEKDKRDQEARRREFRKQKEEDAEREKRKREKEEMRRRREEEIKQQERLKLEVENSRRREEEFRKRESELMAYLYNANEVRERDLALKSSRLSSPNTPPTNGIFIPRTQVPKLPVIGKGMPRTPRKKLPSASNK